MCIAFKMIIIIKANHEKKAKNGIPVIEVLFIGVLLLSFDILKNFLANRSPHLKKVKNKKN